MFQNFLATLLKHLVPFPCPLQSVGVTSQVDLNVEPIQMADKTASGSSII